MTHVMDIGTDLDDLLGRLAGDLTDDRAQRATAHIDEETTDDRGPLVRPLAGLTSPVWYS